MRLSFLEGRWLQLGLRLLLGAVFIYAGALKIIAPQPFADSITTFRLLPASCVDLLALGLPVFEVAVGSFLLLGLRVRTVALGVLMMTGVFAFALASALVRGLPVDCGCFGSGAASTQRAWASLGRDLLLGVGAWLLYRERVLHGVRLPGVSPLEPLFPSNPLQ